MLNRRGISAVVATVLIILITVAAVTIIWAAVIPMINNQISSGTTCLDAVSQVNIVSDQGYTCYDSNNSKVFIQISHGAKDFDLAGVQVLVSEGGDTNSSKVTSGLPGVNEEKVVNVSYTNTTAAGPTSVRIAPIVSVGNTEETCDESASVTLSAC